MQPRSQLARFSFTFIVFSLDMNRITIYCSFAIRSFQSSTTRSWQFYLNDNHAHSADLFYIVNICADQKIRSSVSIYRFRLSNVYSRKNSIQVKLQAHLATSLFASPCPPFLFGGSLFPSCSVQTSSCPLFCTC
jgi:hypothetical protein